jgi:YidC/Oxa1 family membrane protein insertase
MGKILYPLEYAVAWLMVMWHKVLSTLGMPEASGWTWALSIVGLVIVIRIILIPLFVKQIKASRGLQMIQPEMKKIQAKYKGKTDPESRQAMTQETMALYKETGTNPFASCLPIILQAPIFYALFRVLNTYVRNSRPIGPLTKQLAEQADNSTLFGAPLSSTFMNADGNVNVKIITIILIVLMSATTFTTQRQLMMKNMPAAALDNPFAKQQKMLLYVLPVVFAVSGVNFPIGVLLYWLTTNAWSMGQQFYVIRRMPAPGSPAEKALQERRRRHGKGGPVAEGTETDTPAPTGQRVQPKRQARSKRTGRTETTGEPAADTTATVEPVRTSLTKKPAPSSDGDAPTGPGATSPQPSAPERTTSKQAKPKQGTSKQTKQSGQQSGQQSGKQPGKQPGKRTPKAAKPGGTPTSTGTPGSAKKRKPTSGSAKPHRPR